MKALGFLLGVICFGFFFDVFARRIAFAVQAATMQSDDKLVYADFEKMEINRPVSARGGWIGLSNNQENPGNPAKFTGLKEANDAPELVHLKADDPNKAAMFSYELKSPNNYAAVTLSIHGLPDKDGKPVPEDVSAFSNISSRSMRKVFPGPPGSRPCEWS